MKCGNLPWILLALAFSAHANQGGAAAQPVTELFRQAQVHQQAGEAEEAVVLYQQAWLQLGGRRCAEAGQLLQRGQCLAALHHLTRLALDRNQLAAARAWSDLSLQLGPTARPPLGELFALMSRADVLRRLDDKEALQAVARRARTLAEEAPEGLIAAHSWGMVALACLRGGLTGEAMAALDEASSRLGRLEASQWVAALHLLLALSYYEVNATDQALVQLDHVLLLEDAAGPTMLGAARQLKTLFTWFQTPGFDVDSLEEKLGSPSGLPGKMSTTIVGLLRLFEESLPQAEGESQPADRGGFAKRFVSNLADSDLPGASEALELETLKEFPRLLRLYEQGNLLQVAEVLEQQARLPRKNAGDPTVLSSLRAAARVYSRAGHGQRARDLAEEIVHRVEASWEALGAEELRRSLLTDHDKDYQFLVYLLVMAGHTEESFLASERARGRTLLALVENGAGRTRAKGSTRSDLVDELQRLQERIAMLEASPPNGSDTSSELTLLRRDYEENLVRSRMAGAGARDSLPSGKQASKVTLREIHRAIPNRASLVSFFAMNGKVVAWILRQGELTYIETELITKDLEMVTQFREAIAGEAEGRVSLEGRNSRAAEPVAPQQTASARLRWAQQRQRLGRELYRRLIAPLRSHLGEEHLILVPHRALHSLPFAALEDPATGRFLAEDFALTLLPSASLLPVLAKKKAMSQGSEALVLGDPRLSDSPLPALEGARREAKEVARLWGVEPLLGEAATESEFRLQAGEAYLIHIAAHGVTEADHPLFSYLALAADALHDGRLTMLEIFDEVNLLGAPLVVLSACESALGERSGGDETVGLVRAFLTAGASSVVATLWPVDDRSSADLMTTFYRLVAVGTAPSRALQEAQVAAIHGETKIIPHYWAGYGITGGSGAVGPVTKR